VSFHFGKWSLDGLSNLQKAITKVKTHWIEKFLILLKISWACMTHLGKHKLWPKEGSGVKVPIWFLVTKSRELPWFTYMQMACHIPLENSWKGLQFCFTPHLNLRFEKKLWTSKVAKSQFREFRDSQVWSIGTKWHLGARPMARNREYYKGKGGGFPQVYIVVSLVSLCLPMVHSCTKSAPTTH